MKTLKRLLLVILLATAALSAWYRQSIHYALIELGGAARQGDVATVERYVDLEAFVDVGTRFAAAIARAEGRKLGGAAVGALVGGIAEALGTQVADVVRPGALQELRRAIARKEGLLSLGPFRLAEGYDAVAAVRSEGEQGFVTLRGTCAGREASVVIRMARRPGALGLPWLGDWRAVGVDDASLQALASACRDGP